MRPLGLSVLFPACCASVLALAACDGDELTETSIQHPTLVEVRPEDFLGRLPCGDEPGAVKVYVATLTDVTPVDDAGVPSDAGAERSFVLPSSPPTPCTRAVGFSFVVPGRKYEARIEAYDRSDAVPLRPGLPILVDPANGEELSARWAASCSSPVTAISTRTQPARGCGALEDRAPAGATALRVAVEQALAGVECGGEAGQIESLTATLRYLAPGLAGSTRSVSCGEELVFDEVEPNQPVEVALTAFESGASEPSLGTTCVATTAPLVTVGASCTALGSQGALGIDIPAALASVGQSCSSLGKVTAEVLTPAEPRIVELVPPACEQTLEIDRIDVSELGGFREIVANVVAFGAGGLCAAALSCSASVVPGQTTLAECTPSVCAEPDAG